MKILPIWAEWVVTGYLTLILVICVAAISAVWRNR